jgi:hypothetical protein
LGVTALKNEGDFVSLFAHEFGHHVHNMLWADLNPNSKARILEDFFRSRQASMYNARSLRGAQSPLSNAGDADGSYFRDSFSEWFAEQVSRWLTTKAKPVGVVEAFFAKIADFWRDMYRAVGEKFDIVPLYKSVEDLLDSAIDSGRTTTPTRGGIAAGDQEAAAIKQALMRMKDAAADKRGNVALWHEEWKAGEVSVASDIAEALEKLAKNASSSEPKAAAMPDANKMPATDAEKEANVYAKAWEAAVACRVGKA